MASLTSFALASYVTPKLQSKASTLLATHSSWPNSSDGLVTVAAQSDGIHVLDISTLHPIISHSLGPSVTFACPAVTSHQTERRDNLALTYVAIDSSPDVEQKEWRRQIWMWVNNLSQPLSNHISTKKTVVVPFAIQRLHLNTDLPKRLFALSEGGDLAILSTDLEILATQPSTTKSWQLLASFCFPRTECTFAPSRATSQVGVVFVDFFRAEQMLQIRVLGIDDSDNVIDLGTPSVSLPLSPIASVSCSSSGFVSIISHDGSWPSYQLYSSNGGSVSISSLAKPPRLAGVATSSPEHQTISTLALNSSHVLLAALTDSSTPDLVFLLWDLQYAVLLASHSIPIPSATNLPTLHLVLSPAPPAQAVLVISPAQTKASTPARSSVLVIPYIVPAASTIANALGKAADGAKWLSFEQSTPAEANALSGVKTALAQGVVDQAEKEFFLDIDATNLALNDYNLVKELVNHLLGPTRKGVQSYSPRIMQHCLSQKAVASSMLDQGLLSPLRVKHDWNSIDLAFDTVIDLSEVEIIQLLHFVLTAQHEASTTMDIDGVPKPKTPTLPRLLNKTLTYPTTPVTLRLAFRQQFTDAKDILAVLRVLDGWVQQWGTTGIGLLANKKDVVMLADGVAVVRKPKNAGAKSKMEFPSLDKILAFLQIALDATMVTLLTYTPAHPVLRGIADHLEPELIAAETLEHLRGPLEVFVGAHRRAGIDANGNVTKKQEKDKDKEGKEWKSKKRLQDSLGVGPYRLEELVL